jgi:hypothetical protein
MGFLPFPCPDWSQTGPEGGSGKISWVFSLGDPKGVGRVAAARPFDSIVAPPTASSTRSEAAARHIMAGRPRPCGCAVRIIFPVASSIFSHSAVFLVRMCSCRAISVVVPLLPAASQEKM